MRLVKVIGEMTFAGAVVGRVLSRLDDEVPAELVEVDDEGVATAVRGRHALLAVGVQVASTRARRVAHDHVHAQERHLQRQEQVLAKAGCFNKLS